MNWFEKFTDTTIRPSLKVTAWVIVLIALFNEASYLNRSHVTYMVLLIAALSWLALIEPLLDIPYIYFVKETGLFLYAKGSQRIAFDYVTMLKEKDNGGLFGGINNLNLAKPAALNESTTHLVFDIDNIATAILPRQRWYGNNDEDAKVVVVKLDGNRTRMSIGNFMEHQGQLLHDAKASLKSK